MATRGVGAGVARCGLVAALLQGSFACEGSFDQPSAGQTGSPIAPDEDGDVPFLPPEEAPPEDSPQEMPRRPLEDPPLTASFGSWLYMATPRGLFGVDTSAAPPLAPVPLMTDASPRRVSVEGTFLNVVADVVAGDAEAPEGMTEARVFRFDLSSDPARPALLSSSSVPGTFFMAREASGRLVTLSAETEPSPCSALRYQRGARPTGRLVVRDFWLEGDAWELHGEEAVEADGFVETDSGFVLVAEDVLRRSWELTAIDVQEAGLSVSPGLTVEGWVPPQAPMASTPERVALFRADYASGELFELVVMDRGTGAARALSLPAPQERASFSPTMAGRFIVIPGYRSGVNKGTLEPPAIIDWQAEAGPTMTAELPADLFGFNRVGERWLAHGDARSVLFRIGGSGTFELEAELDALPGNAFAPSWDSTRTLAVVPYAVPPSSGFVPTEFGLVALDPDSPAVSWEVGPRTHGYPMVSSGTPPMPERSTLELRRTDAGLFALTTAGDSLEAHQLLERIDLAASQTEVVGFADRPLAVAPAPGGWAEVRASFAGERRLVLSTTAEGAAGRQEVALDHAVERLIPRADGWLAFSLHDACRQDPSSCVPEQRAALHQLSAEPLRAMTRTVLPRLEELAEGAVGFHTYEWLELISQAGQLALIERHGIDCNSEADCTDLGIEFETLPVFGESRMRVQGHRDQRWLHPLDAATGVSAPPVRLDDVEAVGWVTAQGFKVGSGHALFRIVPTHTELSRVLRARSELLLLPSLDAAGVEAQRRITVRGAPMYVDSVRAVTIEPAGPLGGDDEPFPHALVHRLSLRGERAYIEQTLELPEGYVGHVWAEQQGYVLLVPEDRCAQWASTLVVLDWNGDAIAEKGRIELPGTGWQLAAASDRLVLASRQMGRLTEHAAIAVDGEVALRGIEKHPWPLPVSVSDDEARFATLP